MNGTSLSTRREQTSPIWSVSLSSKVVPQNLDLGTSQNQSISGLGDRYCRAHDNSVQLPGPPPLVFPHPRNPPLKKSSENNKAPSSDRAALFRDYCQKKEKKRKKEKRVSASNIVSNTTHSSKIYHREISPPCVSLLSPEYWSAIRGKFRPTCIGTRMSGRHHAARFAARALPTPRNSWWWYRSGMLSPPTCHSSPPRPCIHTDLDMGCFGSTTDLGAVPWRELTEWTIVSIPSRQ
ncbi:hypothetical protein F4809DRAFT_173667 [Biscogniauxia mediterranea]|nr:hypothetical protein F4809DRAFT_173667 [Biscogniauxia mediterranea]